jgi:hypothetical protein
MAGSRTIPRFLAPITEQLELNQPELVTVKSLHEYAESSGVLLPAPRIAFELKQRGWLLPTSARGVYEFSPGANAGAYSRGGKLLDIKVVSLANPTVRWFYSHQSALYMHGIAKQMPDKPQITIQGNNYHDIPFAFRKITSFTFKSNLEEMVINGNPVAHIETLLVQICAKPNQVSDWGLYYDLLEDIWSSCDSKILKNELVGRKNATQIRLKKLLAKIKVKIEG